MAVLFAHHRACELHEPGPGHPERPERLAAVRRGVAASGVAEEIVEFVPRAASRAEIQRVHGADYLARLEWRCARGEDLDVDTPVVPASFEAALRAAGAGLEAVERLDAGEGSAAFLAVRPPGHHALGDAAMGFCLLNNVAVTAAALLERGERVLILDWDAHHGNGTQAAFYDEPDALFVSLHQYPAYPGTGGVEETGMARGAGATINLPFPAGTTGDAYRLAFEEVIVPAAERFSPSWLLVSAGFDGHRADPITDLGLTSGDFAELTERAIRLAPPGRRLFFLEGGYDLDALAASVAATLAALAGERLSPEPPSGAGPDGGRGADRSGAAAAVVARAAELHEALTAR